MSSLFQQVNGSSSEEMPENSSKQNILVINLVEKHWGSENPLSWPSSKKSTAMDSKRKLR